MFNDNIQRLAQGLPMYQERSGSQGYAPVTFNNSCLYDQQDFGLPGQRQSIDHGQTPQPQPMPVFHHHQAPRRSSHAGSCIFSQVTGQYPSAQFHQHPHTISNNSKQYSPSRNTSVLDELVGYRSGDSQGRQLLANKAIYDQCQMSRQPMPLTRGDGHSFKTMSPNRSTGAPLIENASGCATCMMTSLQSTDHFGPAHVSSHPTLPDLTQPTQFINQFGQLVQVFPAPAPTFVPLQATNCSNCRSCQQTSPPEIQRPQTPVYRPPSHSATMSREFQVNDSQYPTDQAVSGSIHHSKKPSQAHPIESQGRKSDRSSQHLASVSGSKPSTGLHSRNRTQTNMQASESVPPTGATKSRAKTKRGSGCTPAQGTSVADGPWKRSQSQSNLQVIKAKAEARQSKPRAVPHRKSTSPKSPRFTQRGSCVARGCCNNKPSHAPKENRKVLSKSPRFLVKLRHNNKVDGQAQQHFFNESREQGHVLPHATSQIIQDTQVMNTGEIADSLEESRLNLYHQLSRSQMDPQHAYQNQQSNPPQYVSIANVQQPQATDKYGQSGQILTKLGDRSSYWNGQANQTMPNERAFGKLTAQSARSYENALLTSQHLPTNESQNPSSVMLEAIPNHPARPEDRQHITIPRIRHTSPGNKVVIRMEQLKSKLGTKYRHQPPNNHGQPEIQQTHVDLQQASRPTSEPRSGSIRSADRQSGKSGCKPQSLSSYHSGCNSGASRGSKRRRVQSGRGRSGSRSPAKTAGGLTQLQLLQQMQKEIASLKTTNLKLVSQVKYLRTNQDVQRKTLLTSLDRKDSTITTLHEKVGKMERRLSKERASAGRKSSLDRGSMDRRCADQSAGRRSVGKSNKKVNRNRKQDDEIETLPQSPGSDMKARAYHLRKQSGDYMNESQPKSPMSSHFSNNHTGYQKEVYSDQDLDAPMEQKMTHHRSPQHIYEETDFNADLPRVSEESPCQTSSLELNNSIKQEARYRQSAKKKTPTTLQPFNVIVQKKQNEQPKSQAQQFNLYAKFQPSKLQIPNGKGSQGGNTRNTKWNESGNNTFTIVRKGTEDQKTEKRTRSGSYNNSQGMSTVTTNKNFEQSRSYGNLQVSNQQQHIVGKHEKQNSRNDNYIQNQPQNTYKEQKNVSSSFADMCIKTATENKKQSGGSQQRRQDQNHESQLIEKRDNYSEMQVSYTKKSVKNLGGSGKKSFDLSSQITRKQPLTKSIMSQYMPSLDSKKLDQEDQEYKKAIQKTMRSNQTRDPRNQPRIQGGARTYKKADTFVSPSPCKQSPIPMKQNPHPMEVISRNLSPKQPRIYKTLREQGSLSAKKMVPSGSINMLPNQRSKERARQITPTNNPRKQGTILDTLLHQSQTKYNQKNQIPEEEAESLPEPVHKFNPLSLKRFHELSQHSPKSNIPHSRNGDGGVSRHTTNKSAISSQPFKQQTNLNASIDSSINSSLINTYKYQQLGLKPVSSHVLPTFQDTFSQTSAEKQFQASNEEEQIRHFFQKVTPLNEQRPSLSGSIVGKHNSSSGASPIVSQQYMKKHKENMKARNEEIQQIGDQGQTKRNQQIRTIQHEIGQQTSQQNLNQGSTSALMTSRSRSGNRMSTVRAISPHLERKQKQLQEWQDQVNERVNAKEARRLQLNMEKQQMQKRHQGIR